MLLDTIDAAAAQLRRSLQGAIPDIALVAGSGLAAGLEPLSAQFQWDLAELPGFPDVSVAGQQGRLVFGDLHNCSVLAFFGRYHVYEGYSPWQVTAQVRLAAAVGCRKILLTNAAGGLLAEMTPGDFMLVTDHLNFTGLNPLIGRREREFVDLTSLYATAGGDELAEALQIRGIRLHRGVLAWMPGPSYETPAEIAFLEKAGAAAVSMSTIPEAIVARRYGLEVMAVSFIANPAAGKSPVALNHQDVLRSGQEHAAQFHTLLQCLLQRWGRRPGSASQPL